jgi:hypothetical protein
MLKIVGFIAFVSPISAVAQSSGVPADFPPTSFTGNQFVDSEGCAFIRAGISGVDTWVPRVDRSRNQLCHFVPTFTTAAVEEEADLIEEEQIAIAADVDAPLTIERSNLALQATRSNASLAAPRIERTASASAVATPVIQTREVPRMTLAEVCAAKAVDGRDYINAATGRSVQCETAANKKPKLVLFAQPEIPASNPTRSVRNIPNPPAGHRRVWSDGRLNTQRGLPASAVRVPLSSN